MYEDGAVFPRPGSAEVPHVQHMGRTMSVSWAFTSPHPDAKQKKAKCRTPKKKFGRLHSEGVRVCRKPFPSKQALTLRIWVICPSDQAS